MTVVHPNDLTGVMIDDHGDVFTTRAAFCLGRFSGRLRLPELHRVRRHVAREDALWVPPEARLLAALPTVKCFRGISSGGAPPCGIPRSLDSGQGRYDRVTPRSLR